MQYVNKKYIFIFYNKINNFRAIYVLDMMVSDAQAQ